MISSDRRFKSLEAPISEAFVNKQYKHPKFNG